MSKKHEQPLSITGGQQCTQKGSTDGENKQAMMVRSSTSSPTKFKMNIAAAHVKVETGLNAGEWLIPTSTCANVQANAKGNPPETLRTYVTAIYLGPLGTSQKKAKMLEDNEPRADIKAFAAKQSRKKT